MSNEYKDWLRDEVIEHLPGGWEVFVEDDVEKLKTANGSVLTISDARALQEAEYNRGYDAALSHIRNLINKEFEDI